MASAKYYFVNGITWWRIVMAPLLIVLAVLRQETLFKWLLMTCFLTDAVDGKLARHYHIAGKRGARLDSLGDDFTVLGGFVGMLTFHLDFVLRQIVSLILVATFCLVQIAIAIRKYGKFTAFHTVLAKIAAVLQGVFLITFFFWPDQPLILFYAAIGVTSIELLEETIMTVLIPQWRSDVKGLYWVFRSWRYRPPERLLRPVRKGPDSSSIPSDNSSPTINLPTQK